MNRKQRRQYNKHKPKYRTSTTDSHSATSSGGHWKQVWVPMSESTNYFSGSGPL